MDMGADGMGIEEGEGGTNGESNMETYTLPYVKQTANGHLLYGSGNSNQGSVTTQSGWKGVGGEREAQERGDICVPMTNSC